MLKLLLKTPLPVVLVAMSFICPSELSLFVGGLRLPPHRVALIALFIAGIVRLARTKPVRLMACDYLFAAYGVWAIGVFMYHEGEGPGLQFGGSIALESTVSYFVARLYITTLDEMKATVAMLTLMVLVVGAIALGESITGTHFVHDILKQVTGYDAEAGIEFRHGFLRAYSTFDHPIHHGTFCASILALAWASAPRVFAGLRTCAMIAFATFLGMSSAPMLALGVQSGLLVWERLSRGLPRRAVLTVAGIAAVLVGMSLVSSRSPAAIIATGFTIDSWTGFYRLLIWEHGIDNLMRNPVFGIGQGDWTREWWMASDSIDAYWLVVALRMGLPAFLLLSGGIATLLIVVHRQRQGVTREMRRLLIAWTFSLIALALAGCTVHYWNAIHAYLFFFLGMTAWIGDRRLARRRAHAMASAARGLAGAAPGRAPPPVAPWPRPPVAGPYGAPAFAYRP